MKRENLIVTLCGVIFLAIGLVITFNIIDNKEYKGNDSTNISDNNTNSKVTNENNVKSEENKVSEDNIVSDKKEEFNIAKNSSTTNKDKANDSVIDKKEETIDNNANQNNNSTSNNISAYSANDNKVINSLNETLTKVKSNVSDSNFLDSAKGVFISVVDFLFYDGEIKGITFDELTDAGKSKVLQIASNIDDTIEKSYPGYKETISDKASSAFNKASEIIKKGANNLNDFTREKLGEENYQSIIDAKDELVYYTKNALNFVGDVSSSLWNSTKDKLNNWYQNFKNND